MQISHAFAIAHHNKLTHGGFNLSQVLLKDFIDVPFFKLTSFRPWLVGSKNPVKDLEISKLLDDEDIFKIACSKDLQSFGTAIYDILTQKIAEDEKFDPSAEQECPVEQMPYLDSIPLCWAKFSSSWCLFEVLHKCMIIDTGRDTVEIFSEIHKLVAQEYRKHFDVSYFDLPLPVRGSRKSEK